MAWPFDSESTEFSTGVPLVLTNLWTIPGPGRVVHNGSGPARAGPEFRGTLGASDPTTSAKNGNKR